MMLVLLAAAAAQQYRAPFADAHYGYFYPTAYYDHAGRDWACGSIRYSGHRGNDFGGGSWSGMDAGRNIVAAADGTVIYTHDGEFDRCSTGGCPGGGGFGNYVAIRHENGRVTWYGHLRKWTVAVSPGQRVSCGQHLGQMGSSGNSTGPHLHFEPRSSSNVAADPFDGPCSGPPSYWTSQGSHGGLPGRTCDTRDNDGDGWPDDQDCDDNNPRVHPGATEVCDDGVDNDCRGGDAHAETWYGDGDGDGYGDDAVRVCGSPPGGVVRAGGDCDDAHATVNPGAAELCDGLDNDCDGEIDDGPPTVMGTPPPALAARLLDHSAPATLAPGGDGEVWFIFENLGQEPWSPRGVWLVADGGGESPLHDEASWAAWDVLAVLDEPVAPGASGAFRGRIRAPADARGALSQTFSLVSDGRPVRCPGGQVDVAVSVREAPEAVASAGLVEDPGGCATAPGRGAAAAWLALLGLALRRRRC